jgi:hypothetical protein
MTGYHFQTLICRSEKLEGDSQLGASPGPKRHQVDESSKLGETCRLMAKDTGTDYSSLHPIMLLTTDNYLHQSCISPPLLRLDRQN